MAVKKKKKSVKKGRILIVLLVVIALGIFLYFQLKPKLIVVTVTDRIEEYDYYIESNATKIQKEYFEKLKTYIDEKSNVEEDYVKLVSKLFVTEFYTLNNKVTNKDIGGVQFIHSNLKDSFINDSSNTVYKYVKENLYGTRKQNLPEVKDVNIDKIDSVRYKNNEYSDNNGYYVKTSVSYKKNLDYPKTVELYLIHEDNKLVIVEMK